ncbi:MAG: hypothetical protein K2G55_16345, partial [Lachnospiraceae bacterium]|nr:hypothetical protein [Lachnospiraceae bacterium]
MSYREQNIVELSEKKISVENLVRLYKDGIIHFPQELEPKLSDRESISDLIRAVRIGIPMAVVFVSELQNGDFLVLEAKDQLLYLLKYIQGGFPVHIEGITQENAQYYFSDLTYKNPRLAGKLIRTIFTFQIIDYRTPKYLHMEVGLFHEKWSIEREQAVRDLIYEEYGIGSLQYYCNKAVAIIPTKFVGIFQLTNEYIVLYLLLCWQRYYAPVILYDKDNMEEQELLEDIIIELDHNRSVWNYFFDVVNSCEKKYLNRVFNLLQNKLKLPFWDRKRRTITLGVFICFYHMCQYSCIDELELLNDIVQIKDFRRKIRTMEITAKNIDSLLD